MKQHITIDQLNQLSEKGKERLRKWWNPRMGDLCIGFSPREDSKFAVTKDSSVSIIVDPNYSKEGFLPLLSIGQMIEYLREKNSFAIYMNLLVISKGDGYENYSEDRIEYTELCDALWQAVKEDLES